MFLAGMALFSAASLACALAPGFAWLLAARAAQGVGAALLMPASLALLGAAFSGEARGRAVGTWAAAGAVSGALGPLAGGWLIDAVGWRSIFLVNLPIAAAAGWLAWRYVDESRGDDAAPLDVGGAFLATAGLGLLTYGLTVVAATGSATTGASVGASATAGLFAVGAGVLALVAFVMLESAPRPARDDAARPLRHPELRRRQHPHALPLRRARRHGRAAAVPADPQRRLVGGGRGRGAAAAVDRDGPRLARRGPARRADRRAPPAHGRAARRRRRLRCSSCASAPAPVDYATVLLPALAVIACGLTLSVAPLTAAVMGAVDAAHVGSASGVNNAIARVGGLLATALLGFVLAGDASAPGVHRPLPRRGDRRRAARAGRRRGGVRARARRQAAAPVS